MRVSTYFENNPECEAFPLGMVCIPDSFWFHKVVVSGLLFGDEEE